MGVNDYNDWVREPVMENQSLFMQLVDPLEMYDDPSFFGPGARGYPYSDIHDREAGRNRPVLETEEDLKAMRGIGRLLHDMDSVSVGIMTNLVNYVIDTGFKYTIIGERRKRKTGVTQAAINLVQDIMDDFFDMNNWEGQLERELFIRSRRDGEFFLALYPDANAGISEVRTVEPEQVTAPPDPRSLEEIHEIDYPSCWMFGVHTREDDTQKPKGYYVNWNARHTDFDYFTTDEMLHMKCNVDRAVKRGITDYFPVYQKIKRLAELSQNTVEGAAAQAAIAFIREHVPTAKRSDVENMIQGNATRRVDRTTQMGNQTVYKQKLRPGTVKDIPSGMKYHPGPMGQPSAPTYIQVIQAAMRDIGVRWCMPEFMVSADASNANYSSTLVAESPFVKNCRAAQFMYGFTFKRIIWMALKWACAFERIPMSYEDLVKAVDVKVEYPDVASRNLLEETQRRAIENEKGVISKRTWATESGRDYDQEQENIAKEPKPAAAAGPPGLLPENGALQGAVQGAIESAEDPEAIRHAILTAIESWDESAHPRDDNGRFVSGGQIEAAKSDPKLAAELRAKTTDPAERAKLEKALGGAGGKAELEDVPNKPGYKKTPRQVLTRENVAKKIQGPLPNHHQINR